MPDQGLPRAARLRKPVEFDRVFRFKQKLVSKYFLLAWGDHTSLPKLGLAIARKQAPHAVQRNLLKRIVRETFRAQRGLLPCCGLIFMARSAAVDASREVLHADARKLMQQLVACFSGAIAPPVAPRHQFPRHQIPRHQIPEES